MTELIKVSYDSERPTVLARDLYSELGVSERFSRWFDRFKEYGFEEGVDYTPYQMVHPQNHQEQTDYQITLDMAKEIV